MEFHLYGIEKRIYSNFTRRFPLQPWVFGLSIVITRRCLLLLGGCSGRAEAPQTCPGDRDSRDKSWGWAPARCSSQLLWETWRHSKAPVRATYNSINQREEPHDSSGKVGALSGAAQLQLQLDSAWISLQHQSSRKVLIKRQQKLREVTAKANATQKLKQTKTFQSKIYLQRPFKLLLKTINSHTPRLQ